MGYTSKKFVGSRKSYWSAWKKNYAAINRQDNAKYMTYKEKRQGATARTLAGWNV